MIRRGIGVQSYVSAGVPYTPSDADALAFVNAAAITNDTEKQAINTLVIDLKAYGIWTKMKALYPFVGGTASAHKFNLKDPRDLDAAFRLVFNGGISHANTGITFNGLNGYGDTKLNISTAYTNTNSVHLSIYSRSNSSVDGYDIGCYNTTVTTEYSIRMRRVDGQMSTNIGSYNNQFVNSPQSNSLGFGCSSRTSSSSLRLFKNGTFQAQNTTSATPSAIDRILLIGASNSSNPISAVGFTNREYAFASIGDGLTDTEAANLYAAVQAYQTSLSRNV